MSCSRTTTLTLFQKILSGIPSECQMVWIKCLLNCLDLDVLSVLIWVQTVCKAYLYIDKELNKSTYQSYNHVTMHFVYHKFYFSVVSAGGFSTLEDLRVLRRSPDLLNNVKIGQGQLQLIMEQILFLPYTFWSSDLINLMNNPSNSPVISRKKMFR